MNRIDLYKLLVLGYALMAIHLLATAMPVGAGDGGPEMLPVDAKLGQYITSQSGSEMAAVDVKLGQYIGKSEAAQMAAVDEKLGHYIRDNFDYAAAADNQVARVQAMADYYARHGLLNDPAVAADAVQESAIVQNAG